MNIILAFMIIYVVYAIGDIISAKTKGYFSSILFCFLFYLFAFWLGLPTTFFKDSGLMSAVTPLLYVMMVNMGTSINFKDFVKQWKTIVIAFCVCVALCVFPIFIGPIFIDKMQCYVAGPILSGAIAAALIMQDAARAIGRDDLVVFATAILAIQKLVGIPLASVCLKKEAANLLAGFRGSSGVSGKDQTSSPAAAVKAKKLIPEIPQKYRTNYIIIAKIAVVAALAEYVSKVVTSGKLSSMISCLLLGIVFNGLGFLEDNAMSSAHGLAFVYSIPMLSVFSGLVSATPELILGQIVPMVVVVALGVFGMLLMSVVMGKLFKWSTPMALAVGSTALFGFPTTLILANEISDGVGETEEEKAYLRSELQPKMVVAGIVTVTLASVFFAGIVAGYMH